MTPITVSRVIGPLNRAPKKLHYWLFRASTFWIPTSWLVNALTRRYNTYVVVLYNQVWTSQPDLTGEAQFEAKGQCYWHITPKLLEATHAKLQQELAMDRFIREAQKE